MRNLLSLPTETKPQEGVDHPLAVGDRKLAYVIRTSERKNFKKCRRYWHFNSPMRMAKEPIKFPKALGFGIAIHNGLEAYYKNDELPEDVRKSLMLVAFTTTNNAQYDALHNPGEEEREDFEEREELGLGMLNHYHQWAQENEDLEILAVEERIRVPIPDNNGGVLYLPYMGENGRDERIWVPVLYQVRIDCIVRDPQGEIWVLDHKTTGRFSGLDYLETDVQISSYVWAASLYYDMDIAGFIYSEIYKKYPEPPRVLKSGKLSKDKRQNTNYDLYVEAIEERELDPEDYSGFLSYLKQREEESSYQYVRRTAEYRNIDELEMAETHIRDEAIEMINKPSIYPNPGRFNCNGCPFFGPCKAMGEQGDWEFILGDQSVYQPRGTMDERVDDALRTTTAIGAAKDST